MSLFSTLFSGANAPGIAAVGDFSTAFGDFSEAKAYGQAATYAKQNAVIAAEAGTIKEAQTSRDIYKVLGQQQAAYAAGGLASSGSAVDVRRASVEQGALQRAIVQEQTQINVTGFEEQAAQFVGLQHAAQSAGVGGILGGILGIFGALIPK